jgi:3-oxoacyl-[acyl-carrier-protein] synthase II
MLVLESLSHARSRGAKIYAELVGYGESFEAGELGLTQSMKKALEQSRISKNKINYINASAASHPELDLHETNAIKNIFNGHSAHIPVSSTKSMLGHTLGASAALGAIATVLSIKNNQIHPTLNLKNQDEACFLDYVSEGSRSLKIKYALCNAAGIPAGGAGSAHQTTLVFKSAD